MLSAQCRAFASKRLVFIRFLLISGTSVGRPGASTVRWSPRRTPAVGSNRSHKHRAIDKPAPSLLYPEAGFPVRNERVSLEIRWWDHQQTMIMGMRRAVPGPGESPQRAPGHARATYAAS